MRNSKGERLENIFFAGQKKLSRKAMVLVKGIVNAGIVLATIIITITSVTAYTSHTQKVDPGIVTFIIPNLLALFMASASILFFLAYFTSLWYPRPMLLFDKLSAGLTTLYLSLAAVIIASSAISVTYIITTDK